MKYSHFIKKLSDNPKEIVKDLKGGVRNAELQKYEDYYIGKQWNITEYSMGETRTTRSGKEMWKKFDDNPAKGFKAGELKVWNWIKMIIDIYTKYVRGTEKDQIKVSISLNEKGQDDLSDEANRLFGDDLNEWVMNMSKQLSVYTVGITKYNSLSKDATDKGEVALLNKLNYRPEGVESVGGLVEIVNPKEIEPLYWYNGVIRGFIRFYYADGEDIREEYGITGRNKEYLYWEAWYIEDDGKLKVVKFADDTLLEETDGKPYQYLPYNLQVNEKKVDADFDLYNAEEGDIQKNIDLQDDLNAFLTDLNILYRQVAIPMLKATDEFLKGATEMDIKKMKANFAKLNTGIGQILFAPLDRVSAPSSDSNQVVYLNNIIDQFYRQTGIPKSVLNSEGISNIATETLDHLFQSLNVVIGHKRNQVSKIIKRNVKLHLMQKGLWNDEYTIDVYFPNMFDDSKADVAKMLTDGIRESILPKSYVIGRYVELLGDAENKEVIISQMVEEDGDFKLKMEALSNTLPMPSQEEQIAIGNKVGERTKNKGELAE